MSTGLADRLKTATVPLHYAVERTGIMPALLRGALPRPAYCALLRNLHAIYAALETGLRRHARQPALAAFAEPTLARAPALAQDLVALHGPHWAEELPLAGAGEAYRLRLEVIGADAPALYLAHAYVRYLGDLAGGQILCRIVGARFSLPDGAGTRFYRFDAEPAALARRLRTALDTQAAEGAAADALVAEAQHGFRLHQRLFEELASSS